MNKWFLGCRHNRKRSQRQVIVPSAHLLSFCPLITAPLCPSSLHNQWLTAVADQWFCWLWYIRGVLQLPWIGSFQSLQRVTEHILFCQTIPNPTNPPTTTAHPPTPVSLPQLECAEWWGARRALIHACVGVGMDTRLPNAKKIKG